MKKGLLYVMTLSVFFAFLNISCSKDDDPETESPPTYPKSQIIGTWEVVGSNDPDFKQCPDGDNKLFTISDTQIIEGSTDLQGCNSGGGTEYDYEYENGNTLNGGLATFKITSLEDDNMTFIATYQNSQDNPMTFDLQRK